MSRRSGRASWRSSSEVVVKTAVRNERGCCLVVNERPGSKENERRGWDSTSKGAARRSPTQERRDNHSASLHSLSTRSQMCVQCVTS
jgi:hypothetical protein